MAKVTTGKGIRIKTTCEMCHTPIIVRKWQLDKFGKVFCSYKCSGKYKSLKSQYDFICENCGKLFTLTRSKKVGEHIFCCYKCCVEFKNKQIAPSKVLVHCSYCGQDIMVWPSKIKLNAHFYCNTTCRANHIIGNNNPSYTSGNGRKIQYGFNWRRQRRKTLERDNYTCQHCHKTPPKSRYLQVHHIIPAHTFNGDYLKANELTNLITLCQTCHKKAERGKIIIQPKLL